MNLSIQGLIHLGVALVVCALIFWLIDFFVARLGDPIQTIVRVIMALIMVVILLRFLGMY